MKNKRVRLLIIFIIALFMMLLPIISVNNIVNAENITTNEEGKKVSSVADGRVSYYVDSVIEEEELDFGVMYHNDKAYTSFTDTSLMIGCIAGGSTYGAESIIANELYSQNVNVLEVSKDSGVEIVPYVNFRQGSWTLTTVTSFIEKYEESHPDRKVIAAINGDFFDINSTNNYNHTSTGGTVTEGNYYKVSDSWKSIGFKNDGSTTNLIGNIMPTISEKPIIEIFDENDNVIYSINVDKINDVPGVGETSAYFSFYNENHNPINVELENAYFFTGNEVAPFSTSSVYGLGTMVNSGSGKTSANTFAIVTNNQTLSSYFKKDVKVRVQYYYTGELEGVDNVIGYPHNIIVNGEPILNADYRHPRTMIGIKEDGTIIMTTVDGRQVSKGYYGVSPVEQAALMQYYGCVNAFNLDGGGSTTVVILQNGKFVIKNSPSDGNPRSDGNCLLITVKVPTLDITFENVSETGFDVKVDVVEQIEKYKELYIAVDDERKQLVDGKASFTNKTKNTSYYYKLYAKIGDDYIGLPFTGYISTSKTKYSLNSISIADYKDNKNNEYYQLSVDISDELKTVVTVVIEINGNRYYMSNDNKINILKSKGISATYTKLIITYDLNNQLGRQEAVINNFDIENMNASLNLQSIMDDINTWYNIVNGTK